MDTKLVFMKKPKNLLLWKYTLSFFSIFCHGVGLICMNLSFVNTLSHLDNYVNYVMKAVIPYAEGVLLAILFTFYCKSLKKGVH